MPCPIYPDGWLLNDLKINGRDPFGRDPGRMTTGVEDNYTQRVTLG